MKYWIPTALAFAGLTASTIFAATRAPVPVSMVSTKGCARCILVKRQLRAAGQRFITVYSTINPRPVCGFPTVRYDNGYGDSGTNVIRGEFTTSTKAVAILEYVPTDQEAQ